MMENSNKAVHSVLVIEVKEIIVNYMRYSFGATASRGVHFGKNLC